MFKPDDPLAPDGPVFQEPWHAQVLALADTMIRAGHFSGDAWARELGANLSTAKSANSPDTSDTYYQCAVDALETLVARSTEINTAALQDRKAAWTRAYLSTPHGMPVKLAPD